uniref:Uncharacterized protein n=1 Tax=Ditylum brightwellii TaxID=49249 RepID=A0A7S1ZP08_9STRA|mmetsp:Transcript_35360/g.52784  ORF Transcript_35360/g.52784 Transcript_35360/m.52784 type:complete len:123 (+) Transcript_35360:250-618(+)
MKTQNACSSSILVIGEGKKCYTAFTSKKGNVSAIHLKDVVQRRINLYHCTLRIHCQYTQKNLANMDAHIKISGDECCLGTFQAWTQSRIRYALLLCEKAGSNMIKTYSSQKKLKTKKKDAKK